MNKLEIFLDAQLEEQLPLGVAAMLDRNSTHSDTWVEAWSKAARFIFTYSRESERGSDILAKIFAKLPSSETLITNSPLLSTLEKGGAEVRNWGINHVAKIPYKHKQDEYFFTNGRNAHSITPELIFKDIVYFVWGIDEIRNYFTDLLQEAVRRFREEQRQRFNEAAALSEDGKIISCPDRVIVVYPDRAPIFDARRFSKSSKKLLRPVEGWHRVKAWCTEDVVKAVELVRSGEYKAVYCSAYGLMKEANDLIVSPDCLRGNLPETSGDLIMDRS